MPGNLEKIVNLIKKTGDKAIVLDQNGDPNYVIMTLADYENLILGRSDVRGLSESEMLEKINRDIAVWKDSQETENLSLDQYDFSRDLGVFDPAAADFSPKMAAADDLSEEEVEDHYYFESVEA